MSGGTARAGRVVDMIGVGTVHIFRLAFRISRGRGSMEP